jgi:hypothetical protein
VAPSQVVGGGALLVVSGHLRRHLSTLRRHRLKRWKCSSRTTCLKVKVLGFVLKFNRMRPDLLDVG